MRVYHFLLKTSLVIIAAFSLLCLTAGAASAVAVHPALSTHAKVWKADPGIGSTVTQMPTKVTVFTLENINPDPGKSNLQVYGPSADATDTLISQGNAQVSLSNPEEMAITITPNSGHINGVYVVFWKTVSADDGDAAAGSFSFTVSTKSGAPAHTSTTTSTGSGNSSTSGVPIWVPIVAGCAALIVGLGAGLGFGRRRSTTSSLATMRASISQGRKEED